MKDIFVWDGKSKVPNDVEHVRIVDGVTSISHRAFAWCENLKSVTIPNSVTNIGSYAFRYCTDLMSVKIPSSVTTIGEGAFSHCEGMTSVTIGNSVTTIGDYAFSDCYGLTIVSIPDSVKTIGDWAFHYCYYLKSITIPYGVTTIGDRAFNNCERLTNITIPDSVTSIGSGAFNNCPGVEEKEFIDMTDLMESLNRAHYLDESISNGTSESLDYKMLDKTYSNNLQENVKPEPVVNSIVKKIEEQQFTNRSISSAGSTITMENADGTKTTYAVRIKMIPEFYLEEELTGTIVKTIDRKKFVRESAIRIIN